eukprot:gb/GECG01016363.1/.p1 GENE.gb/GECG01016363.1/~~gb/GECG01016363.1/.p1  ORF type:complete len:274 (+),score=28.23 gb/GECG01016363.1/:1-822(+)
MKQPRRSSYRKGKTRKQQGGQYVTLFDICKSFFGQQKECASRQPLLTTAVWLCALVIFFTFVSFVAPWVEGSNTELYLFRGSYCGDKSFIRSLTGGIDSRLSSGLSFDNACLELKLNELGGDKKDGGAAAFAFIFIAFLALPILQYFLYRRQTEGPAPQTLLGIYAKLPLSIYSLTCSMLFMLAFAIYVDVVDVSSDGNFSFGVAGTILNFIFLIIIAAIIYVKWDEAGTEEHTETTTETVNPVHQRQSNGIAPADNSSLFFPPESSDEEEEA